jgi:NAD(P)-dependent dehydrogenase (short-subunit alcohol dehydrogenase family)
MADGIEGTGVLITGASRGLGAALALAFAARGARVSLCARREAALRATADAVRARGAECLVRAVDVADETAVAAWVEETARAFGPPGALINNASVLGPRVPLAEYPSRLWREVLDVNLTGAFHCARAVLPHMLRRGAGSIVNVSSGAAVPPREDWGAYAVSKQALEGFSLNLAAELRGSGVRVNIVDPGSMRTSMRAAAYPEEDPATVKDPARAAGLFLWLAGEESREVTGERFRADDWEAARGGAGSGGA